MRGGHDLGESRVWGGKKGTEAREKKLRCKKEGFSLLNAWKKFYCEKEQKNGVRWSSKLFKVVNIVVVFNDCLASTL